MSKSAIYTVNTSIQNLVDGSVLNLGSVIRRFGCNCQLSGNAIRVAGAGYYKLNASIIISPAAANTTITVTAFKDGAVIPGAQAQAAVATAASPVTLPIEAIIRENCACCDDSSNINFVVTGGEATVSNIAVTVEKM